MKITKKLVGVLVLSIAMLGTGYAYWTDGLQVESTAATGELKVDWVEQGVTDVYYSGTADYEITKLLEGSKEANFNIENMSPNAKVSYYANAENKGSIPVKISRVEIEVIDEDEDTAPKLEEELYFSGYYTLYPKGTSDSTGQKDIPINSVKGLTALNVELTKQLKELNKLDIVPGAVVHFRIDAHLSENTHNQYQSQQISLQTLIDWTQENDGTLK